LSGYILAVVSGALLALSFPRYGHPAVAWVALVPLLLALAGWTGRPGRLSGQPPLRAFTLGLVAGLVYFVGTVYWTGSVLATFGQMATPLAIFAMLLLAAYLAIYPALAAVVIGRLVAGSGAVALLLASPAWVATEYLRGLLFTGFPWVPLGNSQVTVLPVAQVASLLGVSGVSMLVASVNSAIALVWLCDDRRTRVRIIAATAALLLVAATWGAWRVGEGALVRDGQPMRVGLIQGNVAQEEKLVRTPASDRRIFTTYLAMTRDAVRRGAQYVIWPESSTPFTFEQDPVNDTALRELAREVKVPILFGSEQIVQDSAVRLYNAAFLLGPDGATEEVYHKIHLVPFGEFFPFQEWISIAAPLVRRFLPFTAGESVVMLPVGGHATSTAICYEVVYPSLIRQAVLNGSELLTTITNDGWYGASSAPYQHFEMAAMRAIEQGRYLARAANTGISGIIDPYGRVTARSGIFEQTVLVGDVRFLTGRTTYSLIGDVVAYAAIAATLLALLVVRPRRGGRLSTGS
jgi:apolipoprotein N-acyltransferase